MRDFYLQTPQKDNTPSNRRSKSVSDYTKNPHKVSKKSLNSVSTAVSENESSVVESPEKSIDFSISENSIASSSPVDTPSSETVARSDHSPSLSSSSVITCDKYIAASVSSSKRKNPEEVNSLNKNGSVEAEMVIKHLRDARIQVTNSNDMDRSKKLLEVLISSTIKELGGSPHEEEDWINELVSSNARVVILGVLLGIFAILVFVLINSEAKGIPSGPPPT
ncbi:uncharacterized protein LOC111387491 isoform X3 [Olea europaea var. sylvestris]|uniref:uncharacterized protein LOC111387491 isoform X3 n=1 Tax=Olea europaea var. sylvestris TaxID=158386 RepID=UPI000C1CE6D8|nr:uncharacterized protein LOC111387491 isoform X3 [Olea europaea var. sylvestris]